MSESAVSRPLRWHEAVAEYFPARYRSWVRSRARCLPVMLAAIAFATVAIGISPGTAFIDEATYITTGYAYLDFWLRGGAAVDAPTALSGVPFVYPVLAAVLDALGGLWLARAVSLGLMVVVLFLVARFTIRLYGYRAGMLAGAAMASVAPVMFLGQHATHDAVCLALLMGALYLGTSSSHSRWVVPAVTAMLVGAVVVKYTAFAFVLPVLTIMVLSSGRDRRQLVRSAVIAVAVVVLIVVGYLVAPDVVREGIKVTTLNRAEGPLGVIAPASVTSLTWIFLGHLGIVLGLVGVGLRVVSWSSQRVAIALTLLGAAAILPATHLILGELSSFEKHLGWAAMFLAPLAGRGLDRLSRTKLAFAPVIAILAVMLSVAETRANVLIYWPEVAPVLEELEQDTVDGTYLAVGATVLKYHSRSEPWADGISWLETFAFWGSTPDHALIRSAIDEGRFPVVILRDDDLGNPTQNAAQEVLVGSLYANDYSLTRLEEGGWRIFTRGDA